MKRALSSRVACVIAVLCALVIPLAVGQSRPDPEGAKVETVRPLQPGGRLGDHLGTYLTVEGVRQEEGKVGTKTLLVDTIGGKKLDKPVSVWVHNLNLPAKRRCVLKGYETGEMIGTPPAVLEAAKEEGRKDVGVGQAGWQWRPYFVALIVVEPQGLELQKQKK